MERTGALSLTGTRPPAKVLKSASIEDLGEITVVDVEDETPDLGAVDEGALAQRADRRAHVLFNVRVGTEAKGWSRPERCLETVQEFLLVERLEAAPGVVDHHDGAGTEELLAEQQRANGIVGREAAGVSNEVDLSEVKTEGTKEVEARVHAGEDREVKLRHGGQNPMTMSFYVVVIVLEKIVNCAHRSILRIHDGLAVRRSS